MNTYFVKCRKVAENIDPKPGFAYSACGPFTKNKERIEEFMQTGIADFIYRNELYKACFQHDMAYGKIKDLVKRTQSDKF